MGIQFSLKHFVPIMMILAVNFPLSALAMAPDALLRKRMAFKIYKVNVGK